MDNPEELRRTLDKLAALNERRDNLIQYRDRQILEAINRGATWKQMEDFTGLSTRGLQKAIQRAKR